MAAMTDECEHTFVMIAFRRNGDEGLEIVCEFCRQTPEVIVAALLDRLAAAERALAVAQVALNETDILRAEAEVTATDLREQIEVLIAQDEVEASIQRNLARENAHLRSLRVAELVRAAIFKVQSSSRCSNNPTEPDATFGQVLGGRE